MKTSRTVLLCSVALLGLSATASRANEMATATHYSQYNADYIGYLTNRQKIELRNYLNYEVREPCQNYREVPNGFYRDHCTLKFIYPRHEKAEQMPVIRGKAVLAAYIVNFKFDSSDIEPTATETLEQVAREITRYNPSEVAVSGHADRAGTTEYNVSLSQRRADTVSRLLTTRGVKNYVINENAFGEQYPAIQTRDGMPLFENRRVVIEFLK